MNCIRRNVIFPELCRVLFGGGFGRGVTAEAEGFLKLEYTGRERSMSSLADVGVFEGLTELS